MLVNTLRRRRQRGQSLLEFAFLLPIFGTMIFSLVQIVMAINAGIVNLKYSRAQLYFIFYNSRHYPAGVGFWHGKSAERYFGRVWVGVDDRIRYTGEEEEDSANPRAPLIRVGQGPSGGSGDDSASYDELVGNPKATRQNVRIRETSFVCLPPIGPAVGSFYNTGQTSESLYLAPSGPGTGFCHD